MWWAAFLFARMQVIQDRWCGLPLNLKPAQMAIPLQMEVFPLTVGRCNKSAYLTSVGYAF